MTFFVAILTVQLKSKNLESNESELKVIGKSALFGAFINLCIGLFFSFFVFLITNLSGEGNMIGVKNFTFAAIITGTLIGGLTAFILVRQQK